MQPPGAPGSVVDRFEIERAVRAGGMSTVYQARDRDSGAPVALKLLSPKYVSEAERFTREAMALKALQHPAIVRYVAHGCTQDGVSYLAMEWLEGEDLATRLERSPLSVEDSLLVAVRIAGALATSHQHGLVHRDLKPSNVFLPAGKAHRAKLIDFGIVRFADRAELTGPGVIFGTPGYMAPEQARGERQIDARVDLYSLGCVLFECVAGRPVFSGAHPTAILAKVVLEEPPRLRSVKPEAPDALDRLLARLLSKIPASRSADALSLVAELDDLLRAGSSRSADVPIASLRPEMLGVHEQRILALVMTAPKSSASTTTRRGRALADDVPMVVGSMNEWVDGHDDHVARVSRARAAVQPFGARIEGLRNGSLVATLLGAGNAADLATQAARCALAIRTELPEVEMVLAMGRGVVGERIPVGDVIDHAVEMLRAIEESPREASRSRSHPPGMDARPVHLDAMTTALLDPRFEVATAIRASGVFALRGEREAIDVRDIGRTLLGRPTPCVGRDRELSFLTMLMQESFSEPIPRVALVTAPAGVGKSRVRHELLRRMRRSNRPPSPSGPSGRMSEAEPHVWMARGDPMSAGSPFGLLAQIVRRAVGMREGEPLSVRHAKLHEYVAAMGLPKRAQRVAMFLGEIVGARFADEEGVQLRAARQDAMLMGDQMRAAFEDLVGAASAERPVVLVLEDLHWGDLPSVQFVDAALRNLRDRPIFVLALARPEVHDVFPKLWAGRGMQEIRLGELTPRSSERLVREVLGDRGTDDVVARIVQRAAGNAFFLEELVRGVAEGGGDALPASVVAMVQTRLERLEPDARRVLRAASVFGQVFWRGGVQALLGETDDTQGSEVDAWLRELVARETIALRMQSKFPGDEEYVFRHALVREGAYGMLTPEDRKIGHMLAAGWLEQVGEEEPMVLAEHLERGRELPRAVQWYRRAAEAALDGNDFDAVVARAERAVACGASGETLGALRCLQTEAHRWRGELAGAEACSLEATRLLRRCTALWYGAVGDLALASGRRGKTSQLVVLGEMLHELGELRTMTANHAIASARAATQLLLAGKHELADKLITQVETLPKDEEEHNPSARARILVAHAYRAICSGDLGTAVERSQAAANQYEKIGDARSACVQRGDVGFAYLDLGAYEQAVSTLREVLDTATRLGRLDYTAATAKLNLGEALVHVGELEEARRIEEEAAEEFRKKGDQRMEGGARISLAEIHRRSGDLEGAERELRSSVELLSVAPAARARALAMHARIELAQGRAKEALDLARDADELLAQHATDEGDALVPLVYAEALAANDRREDARASLVAAHARLLERALKIGDPGLRESFLTRVPENRRTIDLVLEWTSG